jgi:hypothetical protein
MPTYGSTCSVEPISPGVVLKKAHEVTEEHLVKRFTNCFSVERQVFERLGQNPRIVR